MMNKTLLGIAVCAASPFVHAADETNEAAAAQQISRAGTQALLLALEYLSEQTSASTNPNG